MAENYQGPSRAELLHMIDQYNRDHNGNSILISTVERVEFEEIKQSPEIESSEPKKYATYFIELLQDFKQDAPANERDSWKSLVRCAVKMNYYAKDGEARFRRRLDARLAEDHAAQEANRQAPRHGGAPTLKCQPEPRPQAVPQQIRRAQLGSVIITKGHVGEGPLHHKNNPPPLSHHEVPPKPTRAYRHVVVAHDTRAPSRRKEENNFQAAAPKHDHQQPKTRPHYQQPTQQSLRKKESNPQLQPQSENQYYEDPLLSPEKRIRTQESIPKRTQLPPRSSSPHPQATKDWVATENHRQSTKPSQYPEDPEEKKREKRRIADQKQMIAYIEAKKLASEVRKYPKDADLGSDE